MQKAVELLREMKVPVILNQVQYSIFDRRAEEDGTLDYARGNGVGVAVYSPLAQGLLTDKYLKGIPEDSRMSRNASLKKSVLTQEELDKIAKLNEIAAARGQSLAQMAISWVLRSDAVTSVILGASRREQIEDNLIVDTKFTEEELAKIDRIGKGE